MRRSHERMHHSKCIPQQQDCERSAGRKQALGLSAIGQGCEGHGTACTHTRIVWFLGWRLCCTPWGHLAMDGCGSWHSMRCMRMHMEIDPLVQLRLREVILSASWVKAVLQEQMNSEKYYYRKSLYHPAKIMFLRGAR
eukprot:1161233-Pelagomonas_calceolata.AAC.17